MNLCHGWSKRRVPLSATRKYCQEELLLFCKRLSPPFWLDVENKFIPVTTPQELAFACHVSTAYHNSIAYNALDDDGFASDMLQREMAFTDCLDEHANSQHLLGSVSMKTQRIC